MRRELSDPSTAQLKQKWAQTSAPAAEASSSRWNFFSGEAAADINTEQKSSC